MLAGGLVREGRRWTRAWQGVLPGSSYTSHPSFPWPGGPSPFSTAHSGQGFCPPACSSDLTQASE